MLMIIQFDNEIIWQTYYYKKSLLFITILLCIFLNDVTSTTLSPNDEFITKTNEQTVDKFMKNNLTNEHQLKEIDKEIMRNKRNKKTNEQKTIKNFDKQMNEEFIMRNKRNTSSILHENLNDLNDNDTINKNISTYIISPMRDSNDWIYTTVKMHYVTNDESSSFSSSNIDDFPLSDNDLYYNESDYDDDECFSLQCMPYEDYVDRIRQEVINPSMPEWIFVGAHSIVFLVGLIGNALVCVAVYRNHSMRTVTNYFIVNLAVADFMVILFCLPPTVIWDITNTWFFGLILCKVVLYLQNVSVTVSVLTLTFISIDRWYAICYPLKFKSTTGRAKTAIIIIWFIALSTDIPELIVLTTVKLPEPNITEVYYTQCDVQWNKETDTIWNISKTFILYIIPLIFMSFAYCQIVRVLWRTDKVLTHNNMNNHQTTSSTDQHHHHHHHHHHNHHNHQQNNQQQQQRYHPPASSASTPNTLNSNTRGLTCNSRRSTFLMNSNTTTEGQLRSRRKAAKMLVAVVVMFAVCYFPVHFLNIIRHLIVIEQTDCNAVLVLIAHWLIYANSAVNPVIYNFMSGKFRKEFHTTFGCWCFRQRRFNRRRQTTMTRSSTYICRFTTGGGSTNAKTEVIPLSNLPHSIVRRESDY